MMVGLLKQPRQEQMPEQMPPEAMPQDPSGEMGDGGADEKNPAFIAATEFIRSALYEQNAADNINQVMTRSQDPAGEMANIAYEMVSIADEKTEGAVPDELLTLLASVALEEVAGIAMASGVDIQPADIAMALKSMILRFVGEQGYDTRQLDEAMSQISPEQFNQMAAEIGDPQAGAQGMPQEPAQQGVM